jgi:hypothetical protein
VDFYLNGEGFDLKLTPLPQGFGHDIAYAQAHPQDLVRWLYSHQSAQGRFHTANRLFVVLNSVTNPDYTWELRRDFAGLERAIHSFLDGPRLMQVQFSDREGNHHRPTAGVIFCAGV